MLRFAAAAALLLGLVPACAAGPTFTARQDIATGFQSLQGLAIADFNGDGKPDLAMTDTNAKNVYVALNDGKGNFGAPLVTAVNIGSTVGLGTLVAGDVNEDGKQDLIVASVGGLQPTYVLLGTGDGHFTQGASVPGGSFSAGTLVDINGDGHLDFASVVLTAQQPFLSLGDGKGNFTSVPLTPPMMISPGQPGFFTAIVTGDFNRDGLMDLVVAFSTTQAGAPHGLYFYAGAGNNTFRAPTMNPDTKSPCLTAHLQRLISMPTASWTCWTAPPPLQRFFPAMVTVPSPPAGRRGVCTSQPTTPLTAIPGLLQLTSTVTAMRMLLLPYTATKCCMPS